MPWRTDPSALKWVDENRVHSPYPGIVTVNSFVPTGFEAYLRITHPAYKGGDSLSGAYLSWRRIAEMTGRDMNSLRRLEDLVSPRSLFELGFARPQEGGLSNELCAQLAEILRSHTACPDRCFFAFSEILGPLLPESQYLTRAELTYGNFLCEGGPCDQACDYTNSPTIWLPEDRAWIIVTPVDMDSSLIGCDGAAAQELLADARIEAWAVSPEDRVSF